MRGRAHDHTCWSCIHYRQHPHEYPNGDKGYAGFCFDQWPDRTKKCVKFNHTCQDYEPQPWVRGSKNSPDPADTKKMMQKLRKFKFTRK